MHHKQCNNGAVVLQIGLFKEETHQNVCFLFFCFVAPKKRTFTGLFMLGYSGAAMFN